MNYGDRAWTVCSYLQQSGEQWPHHGIKVSPQYPFIEAEIRYAVHHEYAQTAIDFLSRRSRLSFLNSRAALDALPRVIEVMGQELKWNNNRKRQEYERATQKLKSMGISVSPTDRTSSWFQWLWEGFGLITYSNSLDIPVSTRAIFSPGELESVKATFALYADSESGRLYRDELATAIRGIRVFDGIKDKQVQYAIRQVGVNEREGVSMEDFIEVNKSVL
jgi:glycerol-3-phosphate dehydrogenase